MREVHVDAFAAERKLWVSWLDATALVGCGHETIRRAVAAGRNVHRTQASLSRASVLAFADAWAAGAHLHAAAASLLP